MIVLERRWFDVAASIFLVLALPSRDLCAAAASVLLPSPSIGESVQQAALKAVASPELLRSRNTLKARTMLDLILMTAPVARDAPLRYGGDWEKYWLASNVRNQRLGKTLEGVLAWRFNKAFAATGNPNRMLVTAAEGRPHDAADLVEVAPDGTIVRRYQVKLGHNAAIKALSDSKYAGMSIITTRESLQTIEYELVRAEAKAAQRGVPLAAKWQVVRDALDNGQLMREVAGKRLPLASALDRYGRMAVRTVFGSRAAISVTRTASALLPAWAPELLGKGLVVVDFVATGYAEYGDIKRYQAGEISGAYLGAKSGLRSAQLSFAVYALMTPEPVVSKVVAVATVVLIVVDVASEPVYMGIRSRREASARLLLDRIDREERYHAVRDQIIRQAEKTN